MRPSWRLKEVTVVEWVKQESRYGLSAQKYGRCRGGRRDELTDFGGSTVTVFIELHIPTQLQSLSSIIVTTISLN